jgi:hypothetical protein
MSTGETMSPPWAPFFGLTVGDWNVDSAGSSRLNVPVAKARAKPVPPSSHTWRSRA